MPTVVGHLAMAWLWASRYAQDGQVRTKDPVRALERAAGWHGEPGRLVQAMREVGYLEPGEDLRIHDWDDHQGAHIAKAEKDKERMRARRAEQAAASRERSATVARQSSDGSANVARERRGEERRGEERTVEDLSSAKASDGEPGQASIPGLEAPTPVDPPATPDPTPDDLQREWNQRTTLPCPRWAEMPEHRRKKAAARIKEHKGEGLGWWVTACDKAAASDFLAGRKTDWRASPDWMLEPKNLVKVLEGNYDANGPPKRGGFHEITADDHKAFKEQIGVIHDF